MMNNPFALFARPSMAHPDRRRSVRRAAIVAAGAIILSIATLASAQPRRIAITFDDAPRPDSSIMSADERARRLVDALASAGVDEAAFFAVPRDLSESGEARLRRYAEAGHVIANHSANHPNLRQVSAQDFLADVQRADEQLSGLPRFRRWFRYPYLLQGQTVEKRDAVREGLKRMGYRHGYVTVDNYDWYIDRLANAAVGRGDTVDFEGLRELYVEHVLGAVEFYDAVATKYLGHSPRHVLLLHENDLAALYVNDLVARMINNGWQIVRATEAYEDSIANVAPDTLFLGQGHVAAIAHVAGAPARELRSPQEEETVLDAEFRQRVLGQATEQ